MLNKCVCICECLNVSMYLNMKLHVCMLYSCADRYCVIARFALTVLTSCAQSLGRCLRCRLNSGGYRASTRCH